METVSENTPKSKRGRPKSDLRLHSEMLASQGIPCDGDSTRSKVNFSLFSKSIALISRAPSEMQMSILGFNTDEIMAGTKKFPPGFQTAATEIGRFMQTSTGHDAVLERIAELINQGNKWSAIRSHFRALRLGARQGNALSLFRHLARAYDEYIQRFPDTTQEAAIGGIKNLLTELEDRE
jgi:hypothetical protein